MIKNKEKEEKKLKKLDEGFFEQYTDDFADYFENQRVMRIMLGTEYKKINKAICEIKNKYPNVVALLEDGEKTKLNDEEENAIMEILQFQEEINLIELKEAFKLGFKEAYIYFESMDMLKIQMEDTNGRKNQMQKMWRYITK